MAGLISAKSAAIALEAIAGKSTPAKPTAYLALLTATPNRLTKGSELSEATGAEGYARKEVAAASLAAAEEGAESAAAKIKNSAELIFNAITGGSAVVTAWALCDASATATGNVIAYGTCTSTTISGTQTPATVAAGKLIIELK